MADTPKPGDLIVYQDATFLTPRWLAACVTKVGKVMWEIEPIHVFRGQRIGSSVRRAKIGVWHPVEGDPERIANALDEACDRMSARKKEAAIAYDRECLAIAGVQTDD